MAVCNQVRQSQVDRPFSSMYWLVRMHGQHIRRKHMVRSIFMDFVHAALDIHRTLSDHRRRYVLRSFTCQMALRKLVHIPAERTPQ